MHRMNEDNLDSVRCNAPSPEHAATSSSYYYYIILF